MVPARARATERDIERESSSVDPHDRGTSHEKRLPQLIDTHHFLRLRVAQDAVCSE